MYPKYRRKKDKKREKDILVKDKQVNAQYDLDNNVAYDWHERLSKEKSTAQTKEDVLDQNLSDSFNLENESDIAEIYDVFDDFNKTVASHGLPFIQRERKLNLDHFSKVMFILGFTMAKCTKIDTEQALHIIDEAYQNEKLFSDKMRLDKISKDLREAKINALNDDQSFSFHGSS